MRLCDKCVRNFWTRIYVSKDETGGAIKDSETPAERVWERIQSASAYGDCLITVSTQMDISEDKAAWVGLVTGHAYAVLAVLQIKNGTRLLQLKNPWDGKVDILVKYLKRPSPPRPRPNCPQMY
jgi:Calpain family cysteine protease